ncbi:MAG: hypothetical protein JWP89_2714 [Schlesneria sp.]|nr:hypothetical protein [Schlesneria sp.]
MTKTKVKRNPVGKLVTEQMRALLDRIDTATSKARSKVFVDADWCEGYAFEDGSSQPIGPSPTEECTTIKVGIAFHGKLDATRPLIPQLITWLAKCAGDLVKAHEGVSSVKEARDIRALRVLIAQTEVVT